MKWSQRTLGMFSKAVEGHGQGWVASANKWFMPWVWRGGCGEEKPSICGHINLYSICLFPAILSYVISTAKKSGGLVDQGQFARPGQWWTLSQDRRGRRGWKGGSNDQQLGSYWAGKNGGLINSTRLGENDLMGELNVWNQKADVRQVRQDVTEELKILDIEKFYLRTRSYMWSWEWRAGVQ